MLDSEPEILHTWTCYRQPIYSLLLSLLTTRIPAISMMSNTSGIIKAVTDENKRHM